MNAMRLDLSFINKFLMAWGIFLTTLITLHFFLLTLYRILHLFTPDFTQLEFIQSTYVDSIISFLLVLSLLKLFYYQGLRTSLDPAGLNVKSPSADLATPLTKEQY